MLINMQHPAITDRGARKPPPRYLPKEKMWAINLLRFAKEIDEATPIARISMRREQMSTQGIFEYVYPDNGTNFRTWGVIESTDKLTYIEYAALKEFCAEREIPEDYTHVGALLKDAGIDAISMPFSDSHMKCADMRPGASTNTLELPGFYLVFPLDD